MELQRYDAMRLAIAEAHEVDEVKEIRDRAEALRVYSKQSQQGVEDINRVTEIKLRAERRAGQLLRELPTRERARTDIEKSSADQAGRQTIEVQTKTEVIEDAGIAESTARRWQQMADIPDEKFEQHIEVVKSNGEELTTAGLMSSAKKAHVSNSSGNNEWYTPSRFVEAARATMGSIDLDPASSEMANRTVQAETFYTIADDGLLQQWFGNVWMNPPYAQPLITDFCKKIVESEAVVQACILVNNATETGWYQELLGAASAICLVRGRIKFLDQTNREANTPLQGQTVIYIGDDLDAFYHNFCEMGSVAYLCLE